MVLAMCKSHLLGSRRHGMAELAVWEGRGVAASDITSPA